MLNQLQQKYNFSFVLSCLQLYTADWCKKFSAAGRIHHVYLGKPYCSYRTVMQDLKEDVMLKLFFSVAFLSMLCSLNPA